jgi:hypothetical protein
MNFYDKKEYQDDKFKFYFAELNRQSEGSQVFTDNETYAVVYLTGKPVWVWTLQNLTLDKLKELREVLTQLLTCDKLDLTTRKEVYDYLSDTNYPYLDETSYFELGYLDCEKTVQPRKCDGYLDRVREDELDLLANYVYLEKLELPLASLSKEEALECAKRFLEDDTFYVWRNESGKLVAYLNYRLYDGSAKLGNVYTLEEERRKGYCANLVYEVTKKLLESGLKVLLFTDYKYPNSNNAYKKVGYEDKGFLVNYTLRK